ncbi:MAG: hypothetical protein RIE58_00785 [Vicingaceae bacterium]
MTTERIFDSNQRLFSSNSQSENAEHLHNATLQVNTQIELIAAKIVSENTPRNATYEIQILETMLERYQTIIERYGQDKIQGIDDKAVKVLSKLNAQLALNSLARLQQELAVNENCYLTSVMNAGE